MQDTGFPTIAAASRPNSMNFWMAVDKATVANGCLFVAPGSHSQTLPHDPHPVQGRVMQADAAASLAALVPVELEPGDGTSARFLGSWKLPFAFQETSFLQGFSSTRRSRTCPRQIGATGAGERMPASTAPRRCSTRRRRMRCGPTPSPGRRRRTTSRPSRRNSSCEQPKLCQLCPSCEPAARQNV